MLLTIDIESKSIGNKELFHGLRFSVEQGEKVAVIGRNGVGKTTLFGMLAGNDTDYAGTIQARRGLRLVSTAQEHHGVADVPVIDYVLHNLPEYAHLKHITDTYPLTMGDNLKKIETYSTALERFADLGYYEVEDKVLRSLQDYGISAVMAAGTMGRLSGGQKRFVELVRIEHADADLALADEPTNHMDYESKAVFVDWLRDNKQAVLVITHDRDVLQVVDRIIELKDGTATAFKGNYQAYLNQNAVSTVAGIHDYQIGLKTLDNLQRKIVWARARKPSWHGTADQRNPFKVMEERLQRDYDTLKSSLAKPSFWIDRESARNLPGKISDNYDRFKAKNIKLRTSDGSSHSHELLALDELCLGYSGQPLFEPVRLRLGPGDRVRIAGRNGAGKTTLVKAIVAAAHGQQASTVLSGTISCGRNLRLSLYEQELDEHGMQQTLAAAIEQIYRQHGQTTGQALIKSTMSDYLFDPQHDGELQITQLSGGQKARLQIIRMLAGQPNVLILDEPTNHLDLPSIEELENALQKYTGAILYVSHDSFFAANIGDSQQLRIIPTSSAHSKMT